MHVPELYVSYLYISDYCPAADSAMQESCGLVSIRKENDGVFLLI